MAGAYANKKLSKSYEFVRLNGGHSDTDRPLLPNPLIRSLEINQRIYVAALDFQSETVRGSKECSYSPIKTGNQRIFRLKLCST